MVAKRRLFQMSPAVKKRRTTAPAASRAVKAYVNRRIRAEKEKGYTDTTASEIDGREPSTDGTAVLPLNSNLDDSITEGLESAVNGLTVKHTRLEGTIVPVNGAATSHVVRYVIAYDREPDGVLASVTDLFEEQNSSSLYKVGALRRFKIISDRRAVLGGNTSATKESNKLIFKYDMKLNVPQTLAVNTGFANNISAIRKGAILLFALGDAAAASTSISNEGQLRLYYEM